MLSSMFSRIFGTRNQETDQERKGSSDKGETKGNPNVNEDNEGQSKEDNNGEEPKNKGFNETYWQQMMISTVAHEYLASWDTVCKLSAIEFLNIYQFVIDRKKQELEIQKKSLSRLRSRY